MSLTKKDPSLRVAANDPHLVSLGGGRLSTAVTIHYIPIGDTTIGSSSNCSISLNGSGIQPVHCTIYRSELNEVILVPEKNARVMLDGQKINKDANLTQGAMLTIGNYNFLRFNNPAEAQIMRSALNNDDEISSQMDFAFPEAHGVVNSGEFVGSSLSTVSSPPSVSAELCQSSEIERFYKTNIGTRFCDDENFASEFCSKKTVDSKAENKSTPIIDINGVQCPKVFTADLVTVNMPAKDVLGQKYASFAKNFAENLRSEKPMNNNNFRNNQQVLNTVNQPSPEQQHPAMHYQTGNYVNIPNSTFYIQNSTQKADGNSSNNIEYLSKVNNTTPLRSVANNIQNLHHDRYPKLGNYGGLQIYPMNGLNTEINNGSTQNSPLKSHEKSPLFAQNSQVHELSASTTEKEVLEDMLKICAEYADRQEQNIASNSNSITSSPIVQNRIKTNGSLPREKKSPFHHEHSGSQQQTQAFNTDGIKNSISPTAKVNNPVCSPRTAVAFSYTGYENVRLLFHNRVEINGQLASGSSSSNLGNNTSVSTSNNTNLPTGYENVVVGKYVPQSPRTKIRTNCMSPKKENALCNVLTQANKTPPRTEKPKPNQNKTNDYEQLIKTFEEKLNLEMQAIEESSRYQIPIQQNTSTPQHIPAKRSSKNINNLTLSLQSTHSLQNSPKLNKKPAPAPRNLNRSGLYNCVTLESAADVQNLDGRKLSTDTESQNVDNLKAERKELLATMQLLKVEISELTIQEDEALREVDLEKALVSGELTSVEDSIKTYKTELSSLKNKIYRLEAQRNATRVMEENQQAKLKQSIEMKQDQVKKLKAMLKQKPNNTCLKEEIRNVSHSLENERKSFEDLEFQYLEEESEWHAYREELHAEENGLLSKLEEKQLELQNLRKQELHLPISDAKSIQHRLTDLCSKLKTQQRRVKSLENMICDITGQLHVNSSDEDDLENIKSTQQLLSTKGLVNNNLVTGMMSQSLFGSAELLFPKRTQENLMSKSVNENMFYNNNIELPVSTVPNIDVKENSNNNVPPAISTPKRPQLRVVDIVEQLEQMNVNENMHVHGKHPSRTLLDVSQADVNSELQKCELKNAGEEENDNEGQNERLKFNLSLGSDDFEVNPLERRVPSQDDIDRICKVTLDAPISTKGASTKIFDSIKEIERNRQLLLAQQGHHVIEHERQKMHDLKKKCHDEARAQYLSMVSTSIERSNNSDIDNINDDSRNSSPLMRAIKNDNATSSTPTASKDQSQQAMQKLNKKEGNNINKENTNPEQHHLAVQNPIQQEDSSQQRRSHPEFANTTNYEDFEEQNQEQVLLNTSRNSRPLSESNSEYCYDALNAEAAQTSAITTATINAFKADKELPAPRSGLKSGDNERQLSCSSESNSQEDKRASVNSNDTSAASGTGSNSDRKRTVPKHQRPLTRYLPIFSPDLNLRHHIETAGHQIGLCPHVFVDAFSCRGYLHKLGATFHGWARRWFVLDRQRCAFIYYADKSERKPRGGAYFSTIDEVYLDHLNASKSGRPHSTFIVKTKKRSYHLQAVSDAAARIWIDAIITGAQGNLHLYPPIL